METATVVRLARFGGGAQGAAASESWALRLRRAWGRRNLRFRLLELSCDTVPKCCLFCWASWWHSTTHLWVHHCHLIVIWGPDIRYWLESTLLLRCSKCCHSFVILVDSCAKLLLHLWLEDDTVLWGLAGYADLAVDWCAVHRIHVTWCSHACCVATVFWRGPTSSVIEWRNSCCVCRRAIVTWWGGDRRSSTRRCLHQRWSTWFCHSSFILNDSHWLWLGFWRNRAVSPSSCVGDLLFRFLIATRGCGLCFPGGIGAWGFESWSLPHARLGDSPRTSSSTVLLTCYSLDWFDFTCTQFTRWCFDSTNFRTFAFPPIIWTVHWQFWFQFTLWQGKFRRFIAYITICHFWLHIVLMA